MSGIKIHLEQEELDAVSRLAAELKATPEELAYEALDRVMLDPARSELRARIEQRRSAGRHDLAVWSDSAHSVQIYEGRHDVHSHPVRRGSP